MKKLNLSLLIFLVSISMVILSCSQEVHTHTYSTEWTSDESVHWHSATCGCKDLKVEKFLHTFGDWTTTQEPTEEAEGSKERSCTVCGYKATEVIEKLAHTHKFSEDWASDGTYHWHAATCEHTTEVSEKAEHSFSDWTTIQEPTEEAEGSKKRTCTVCSYKSTEVIEKLAHTHKFSEDWTSDGTYHWKVCICGEKKDEVEHSFCNWQVTQEPTETTDGINEKKCDICQYVQKVTLQCAPEGFVFVKGGTIEGAWPSAIPDNDIEIDKKTDIGVFIEGRTVILSDFYMGKYEVTQAEYASAMQGQKVTVNGTEYTLASDPSCCKKDSTKYTLFEGDVQEKRPVEGVTWYDAVWYCNALSSKEGLTPAYDIEVIQVKRIAGTTDSYIEDATVTLNTDATGYRLPTEAEWEYAARGGDPTAADWNYTFSGADTAEGVSYSSSKNSGLDTVGWYCYNNITGITGDSNVSRTVEGSGTHEVGKKAANRLGIYDMSGNIFEFCYDTYNGVISTGIEIDPVGGKGPFLVVRGGSWGTAAGINSVLRRGVLTVSHSNNAKSGFRVVRSAN